MPKSNKPKAPSYTVSMEGRHYNAIRIAAMQEGLSPTSWIRRICILELARTKGDAAPLPVEEG